MAENPPEHSLPVVSDPAQLPDHLERLAETTRNYARGAKAPATQRAYASDWRHYTAWCQRKGLDPLPPDPQVIGLYLAACVSEKTVQVGLVQASPVAVRTIERRLSGHSLRAGLATAAEVDERYVQKQLGHASAEMTRRYQRRRERFRVNLTRAAGL